MELSPSPTPPPGWTRCRWNGYLTGSSLWRPPAAPPGWLGLSIAKVLTERMGGTVSAQYADGRLRVFLDLGR